MNKTLVISAIALIAVMMVVGAVSPAIAKEGNNGSNGCEKSNVKSKACEKNPNSNADVTCADCLNAHLERISSCESDEACIEESYAIYVECQQNAVDYPYGLCGL